MKTFEYESKELLFAAANMFGLSNQVFIQYDSKIRITGYYFNIWQNYRKVEMHFFID